MFCCMCSPMEAVVGCFCVSWFGGFPGPWLHSLCHSLTEDHLISRSLKPTQTTAPALSQTLHLIGVYAFGVDMSLFDPSGSKSTSKALHFTTR